jgi:short-subunit dehydrogenase
VRIAVVTGGSTGIGAALARELAARGWRCVLLARNLERLQKLADEIGAEAEACDISNRAEVDQVAARIAERHPAVHLLVNNAGIPAGGTFLELPPERIEQVIRTNYLGGVWCLRAFLPLLEAGAPAQVVNVVSIAGLVTGGAYGPYAAAKHAQLAFSRAIARELAPRGISVLTVNPGPVETEGFPQRDLLRRSLARRAVLQPDEVARRTVKALERGRAEVVLPRYLRAVALAESVAPTFVSRLVSRGAGRGGAPRGPAQPPQ